MNAVLTRFVAKGCHPGGGLHCAQLSRMSKFVSGGSGAAKLLGRGECAARVRVKYNAFSTSIILIRKQESNVKIDNSNNI